ncbi:MAG: energy transducer TonB [Rhodanobacter sp.]
MPRLRFTLLASVLGLLAGIAGTAWLSGLTATGYAPHATFVARRTSSDAASPDRAAQVRKPVPRHVPARVRSDVVASGVAIPAIAPDDDGELVPQVMAMDDSQSWERLRGHLDGQVLLAVSVDGGGRVTAARIAQSSGDELLDAHALRSVHRWRFAVPADRPDGMHGEVPMRFTSAAKRAGAD